MVQNMVQEHLFRSIVEGDVQSETDFTCEAVPGALGNILRGKGFFTKIACMIDGMLQNMVQEYLFRSIGGGAGQSEADFICEAVPGALEENILIGKGLFTKVACMIYGMVQNLVQEQLFRSIVKGAVQSETNFICEALPGALEEKILIGKGRFTKVARMIYGMVQNMVQEHLFRSIVEGGVQSETDFTCEAVPGALEGNILRGKGFSPRSHA